MNTDRLNELEQRALSAVDQDEMWRTLEYLNTVDRTSGTEGEFEAVRWLCQKLEAYGVEHEVHEFDAYLSFPIRASLRVTAPIEKEIRAKTRSFGASTPPSGLSGEIVFVPSTVEGIGFQTLENQFAGYDVRGKIVLSPRGGPDGVYDAMRAGAIAHIHYWPSPEDAIHEMISTTVWGTPTPESAGRIPTIPSLSINNESGLWLRELIEQSDGPVKVTLTAETETRWCKQLLPVATIRGNEEPEQFMLVASHIDSWYVGITDNGTGNAACLELARVLQQHQQHLKRSVKIAWWTGHSTGRYAGSTWYCDNHFEELRQNCIGYIDIDSPGSRNATVYDEITCMMDAWDLVTDVIETVAGQTPGRERPPRAGDYSFYGPGIPSFFMLMGSVPPEQRYAVGGCGLNWWWHTEYDTLETADAALLKQDTQIYLLSILRVINATVLPYRLAPVAVELQEALAGIQADVSSHFDLAPVAQRLERLHAVAAELDAVLTSGGGQAGTDAAVARQINHQLMRAQRALIPINYTYCGEFDHDPAYYHPVLPLLDEAKQLLQHAPDSDKYRFLQTKLVRNRNKVMHHLREAIAAIEAGLALAQA